MFLSVVVILIGIIIISKVLFKADVTKLANYQGSGQVETLNVQQKTLSIGFIAMIGLMLIPAMLPQKGTLIPIITEASSGMPLGFVAVMAMVSYKNQPILDLQKVISKKFNWSSYFLCGAAIVIGNALTNQSTGISECLKDVLSPVFMGMPVIVFPIIMAAICVLITNFCNSLVLAMIMEPIIRTFCDLKGVNGAAITVIVLMASLMPALCTPAASPFAAVLHGNKKWLTKSDIYKFTLVYVGVELIAILTAGIFFGNVFN